MNTDASATIDFSSAVAGSHYYVLEALDDHEGASPVAAVGWISAHLAAVDRVLYPAAQRHLPQQRHAVRAARAADRRLQGAVFRLDRRLTGDATMQDTAPSSVVTQVRQALQAHAETEAALVDALRAVLSTREQQVLAERLDAVLSGAPTRAHPYLRHTPLSPVVGWCDAVIDRVRDVLDNRVDPRGRSTRTVRPAGRWACYLMGVPFVELRPSGRGDPAQEGWSNRPVT